MSDVKGVGVPKGEDRLKGGDGYQRRKSIAQAAEAVARHRRENERRALFHEILLIIGGLLIVAACAYGFIAYSRHKAAIEKQKHDQLMAEREREEKAEEARRAALNAERERQKKEKAELEAKRAREKEELLKKRQQEREEEQKIRSLHERYVNVQAMLRNSIVDYWKNAPAAERPGASDKAATFVCLFPGSGNGYVFYEIRTEPGKPNRAFKLQDKQEPEPVPEADFNKLCGTSPYLVVRDLGTVSISGGKSYFVYPAGAPRRAKNFAVPDEAGVFNPSKEDFGELYEAIRALNMRRTAFWYRITVKSKALLNPMELPRNVYFGNEVGRQALRESIASELKNMPKRHGTRLPTADEVLQQGRLIFTAMR